MASVWPLLVAAGGGAFLLFTSYRALHAAREWLAVRSAPGPVLVQGTGSRSQLLEDFRAAGDAILLGTGSFWQGVDVRGPALRIVVIDKLPFAAPDDPLVQARVEAIRREGGDPFNEFQLPQAVLTLKQGVGRLIRDFADRGLIVLGDPRVRTKAYGRLFIASLPPMPQLDAAAVRDYAASLAPGCVADGVLS
jgi:ATP-dependent DNA helicase DinG